MVSREMDRILSTSLEMARQVSALGNYVDSVADDLERIKTVLQNATLESQALTDKARVLLGNEVQAHAQGLQVAINDFGLLR